MPIQRRERRINENKEMLFSLGMVSCSQGFEQFEYQSTVQLTKLYISSLALFE